jgi:two-component system NarL family response regulator
VRSPAFRGPHLPSALISSHVIRVLIADDHTMVRMGLREMLSLSPDISVVAEACDGREALALFREHRPDVALLDVRMPGWSGIETIEAILAEFRDARLIAVSNYEGEEDVYRAIRAGAQAYVFKNVGGEDLIQTIVSVHEGRQWLSPEVASRLAERVGSPSLTPRELEVLQQMARGSANSTIGSELGISHETVKVHVKRILDKLGADTRSQAVSMALQKGIVHLD